MALRIERHQVYRFSDVNGYLNIEPVGADAKHFINGEPATLAEAEAAWKAAIARGEADWEVVNVPLNPDGTRRASGWAREPVADVLFGGGIGVC